MTSGVRVKGGREERGNNTVCTSGVIACDAMLIMRKVASGMGRAFGWCRSSNWGKVFLINASGELKIVLSALYAILI